MRKISEAKRLCIFLTFMLAIAPVLAGMITYKCTVNKRDAVFKPGEKICFTARMLEDGKNVSRPLILRYILYHDHKVVKDGSIKADQDIALETSLDRPGWVFLQLFAVEEYKDGNVAKKREVTQTITKNGTLRTVKASGGIGAMVSPEQITPSMNEPDDFDEFWNNAKKELASVPVKLLESKSIPQDIITKANIPNPEKYIFSDIKIQCAGGMPVSGYLTIPKNAKKGSLPAIVTYHGAGVRSANLHAGDIANNIIVLNVNAHGIENGKPKAFYDDLRKNYYFTTLDAKRQKNYLRWNRDDRNKYYMRGMYLRVLRALEYVKSLPEWDGKHLLVSGTSQGGTQSIVAAALDKDVTFARAGVPGWCDISGVLADRRSGGGNIYSLEEVRANPVLANEASYFDCVFFARRIKCPIYINTGFADTVCAPSSVFAAYNQIPSTTKKHIQTVPDSGHSADHNLGRLAIREYLQSTLKKEK